MENLTVSVPSNLENMQLPSPELLTYYNNLKDRVIWVDFDIDDTLLEVIKQIMFFNKQDVGIDVKDRQPIKIILFSYGGSIDTCFTFLDVCELSKTPIWTVNIGISMSAACLMSLAGHKRFCLKNSQYLIHDGSTSGIQGEFNAVQEHMNNYKRVVDIMRQYIINKTNIDTKLFNKKKSKEWYVYAEEAVSLGMCDKIIDDIDEIL